ESRGFPVAPLRLLVPPPYDTAGGVEAVAVGVADELQEGDEVSAARFGLELLVSFADVEPVRDAVGDAEDAQAVQERPERPDVERHAAPLVSHCPAGTSVAPSLIAFA